MVDVIVVGGGIIGQTVAGYLHKHGREVTVLDAKYINSGTVPSGGHIKPSWLAGMSKVNYDLGMEALGEVWDVMEEEFVIRPSGVTTTVYRVDSDVVVAQPVTKAEVTRIVYQSAGLPVVHCKDGSRYTAKLLVVAAGAWCRQLLPEEFLSDKDLVGKWGVSYRFPGQVDPFINTWAPYRQIVAHQQSKNEIWIGDGTAIIQGNWTDTNEKRCRMRCRRALSTNEQPIKTLMGLRPYAKTADPCVCRAIGPKTWVVTGAGKLGTIAAGWAARRIHDATT